MDGKLDYLARYDQPADVLDDASLSTDQKRNVLEQWKLDAERRSDSAQEGLEGGRSPALGDVVEALRTLPR